MKAKQISDDTLKISITLDDLAERGMEMTDFIIPHERTEEFLHDLMGEIDLPTQFLMSGMLSFKVTPRKDRIDILVTSSKLETDFDMENFSSVLEDGGHLSPEEFFKNLEKELYDKGDKEALDRLNQLDQDDTDEEEGEDYPDYTHHVLTFDQLEDVIQFANTFRFPISGSELYKYQNTYYLTVLFFIQNKPAQYRKHILARVLEHAKLSPYTRAFLREHAWLLREGNVLLELVGLEG